MFQLNLKTLFITLFLTVYWFPFRAKLSGQVYLQKGEIFNSSPVDWASYACDSLSGAIWTLSRTFQGMSLSQKDFEGRVLTQWQSRDTGLWPLALHWDRQRGFFVLGYVLAGHELTWSHRPSMGPMMGSTGVYQGFLARYDASGQLLWSRTLDLGWRFSPPDADAASWRLLGDAQGRLLLAGQFQQQISFGPNFNLQSRGAEDWFLTGLDAHTGSVLWSEQFGSSGRDLLQGLCLGDNGFWYAAGAWEAGAFYGRNLVQTPIQPTLGGLDICLIRGRMDNGRADWIQTQGGFQDDETRALCLDGQAGVFWAASLGVSRAAVPGLPSNLQNAPVLYRYAASGQVLAQRLLRPQNIPQGFYDLSYRGDKLLVLGQMQGSWSLAEDAGFQAFLPPISGLFVAAYDAQLNYDWHFALDLSLPYEAYPRSWYLASWRSGIQVLATSNGHVNLAHRLPNHTLYQVNNYQFRASYGLCEDWQPQGSPSRLSLCHTQDSILFPLEDSLRPLAGWSYRVFNASGMNQSFIPYTDSSFYLAQAGWYVFQPRHCGSNVFHSFQVELEPSPPPIQASVSGFLCSGELADVFVPDGPYRYLWQNGASTAILSRQGAGWYWLEREDTLSGCLYRDSLLLEQVPMRLDSLMFFRLAATETASPLDSLRSWVIPSNFQAAAWQVQAGLGLSTDALGRSYVDASILGPSSSGHLIQASVWNGSCWEVVQGRLLVDTVPNPAPLPRRVCRSEDSLVIRSSPSLIPRYVLGQPVVEEFQVSLSLEGYLASPSLRQISTGQYEAVLDLALVDSNLNYVVITWSYHNEASFYQTQPPFNLDRRQRYRYAHHRDTVWLSRTNNQTARIQPRPWRLCSNDDALIFQANGQDLIWRLSQAGQVLQTSDTAGFFILRPNALALNASTLVLELQTRDSHCLALDTLELRVEMAPDAGFGFAQGLRFCQNQPPVQVQVAESGGVFNRGIQQGWFAPANLGVGRHEIQHFIWNLATGCSANSSLWVEVVPAPDLQWPNLATDFCLPQQASLNLTAWDNGQARGFKVLDAQGLVLVSDTGSTVQFNLTALTTNASDSFNLIFWAENQATCRDSLSRPIYLHTLPSLTWLNPLPDSLCRGSAALSLQPHPLGGFWTSGQLNNFDSSNFIYTPRQAGADTLIYHYHQAVCHTELRAVTQVIASLPPLTWQQGPVLKYCPSQQTPETWSMDTVGLSGIWSFELLDTLNRPAIQVLDTTRLVFYPDRVVVWPLILQTRLQNSSCTQVRYDTLGLHQQPFSRLTFNGSLRDSLCSSSGFWTLGLNNALNPLQFQYAGQALSHFDTETWPSEQTYLIEFSFEDAHNCQWQARDSVRLLANPAPRLANLRPVYCAGSSRQDTIWGLPSGGQWSSNLRNTGADLHLYPQANGAIFLPHVALRQADTVLLRYEVEQPNGCRNAIEQILQLQTAQMVQIAFPQNGLSYCARPALETAQLQIGGIGSGLWLEAGLAGQWQVLPQARFDANVQGLRRLAYVLDQGLCSDTVFTDFQVLPRPQIQPSGLDSTYCLNAGLQSFQLNLSATQQPPLAWSAHLASGLSLAWSQWDQSLILDPSLQQAGLDTLSFVVQAANQCSDTLAWPLRWVAPDTGLALQGLQAHFCQNQTWPLINLQAGQASANLQFQLYDDLGQLVLQRQGPFVLPLANLQPSRYTLNLAYTNAQNCQTQVQQSFKLHAPPNADFAQLAFCQGDTIWVEDRSTLPSGPRTGDSLISPLWLYQGAFLGQQQTRVSLGLGQLGWSHLALIAQTQYGCRDTAASGLNGKDSILIYARPRVNWTQQAACTGQDLAFVLDSDFGLRNTWQGLRLDSLTRAYWSWGDGQETILNPNQINDTTFYRYARTGRYTVKLWLENRSYCSDSLIREVLVAPSYQLSGLDQYEADLLSHHADWLAESGLWQWSQIPSGPLSNPQPTWNLNQGQGYVQGQSDVLYLPCFDLRTAHRPMLYFDWQTDLSDLDGFVLQYYDQNQGAWLPLGQAETGWNWAVKPDVFALLGLYPNQVRPNLQGWSGQQLQTVQARHGLSSVQQLGPVLPLRLVFRSLAGLPNRPQANLSISNLGIKPRPRRALIEYFTQSQHPQQRQYLHQLYTTLQQANQEADVVFVQYHLEDSLHARRPQDANARRLYYGTNPHQAILQGHAFQGLGQDLSPQQIIRQTLLEQPCRFELQSLQFTSDSLHLRGVLHFQDALPWSEYQLQIALQQRFLAGQQGVLRQFVPEHVAAYYLRSWSAGDSLNFQWSIPNQGQFSDWNNSDLQLSLWFENAQTREVLEAYSSQDFDYQHHLANSNTWLQTEDSPPFDWQVFPNPVAEHLQVRGHWPLTTYWSCYTLDGRLMQQGGPLSPESWSLSVQTWPSAWYVLVLKNQLGQIIGAKQWFKLPEHRP